MEKENKDKNIVLTDEELKEVAAGAGPISAPSEALDKACRNFNLKGCLEKPFCMWKDGNCIWNPNS